MHTWVAISGNTSLREGSGRVVAYGQNPSELKADPKGPSTNIPYMIGTLGIWGTIILVWAKYSLFQYLDSLGECLYIGLWSWFGGLPASFSGYFRPCRVDVTLSSRRTMWPLLKMIQGSWNPFLASWDPIIVW